MRKEEEEGAAATEIHKLVNNSGLYTVLLILSAFPHKEIKRGEMRQSL